MGVSFNPIKLLSDGERALWGSAKNRPNCKKDPVGAYFCDLQSMITPIDCYYTPLIVGGIIWVGSYWILSSWRVSTILGSAYTAYAYSPLADGDAQDKEDCGEGQKGLIHDVGQDFNEIPEDLNHAWDDIKNRVTHPFGN